MGTTLKAVTAGLPISAKEILASAIQQVYDDGVVEMSEISKDELRSSVRMSSRDITVVLVVLDEVSTDICKDIERGLYSSDKFYAYKDDAGLVAFLNNKYGISLEVPEKVSIEVSNKGVDEDRVSSEDREYYETLLQDKDKILLNYESQIKELQSQLNSWVGVEDNGYEIEDTKAENLELRSKISTLESEIAEYKQKSKSNDSVAKEKVDALIKARDKYKKGYEDVSKELSELRESSSQQAGLIRTQRTELDELRKKAKSSGEYEAKIMALETDKMDLANLNNSMSDEVADLKGEISLHIERISALEKELSGKVAQTDLLSSTKESLKQSQEELQRVSRELRERERADEELQGNYNDALKRIEDFEVKVSEMQSVLNQNDKDLMALNSVKIKLQEELSVLRASQEGNEDIESLMSEVAELRRSNEKYRCNVFNRLYETALPRSSSKVNLVKEIKTFKKIRFAFSGSSQGRKGTYKCFLDEVRKLPDSEKVLIVDVVSETSVDYVFEIGKMVSGLSWFTNGGGVQPYLSKTSLSNVKVLSPGLTYINDSFFLTVDWVVRLEELEKSGYNVILYCGDISNVVGRVLYESFADLGACYVYVLGNAVGSRTVITNMRGLTKAKNSIVAYFDFNEQMKQFYDMVAKTNECRVISKRKGV